ncbi:MAG: glycosyltransferase [Nocardioides sp.]|uniref:glycosyltransferase n=1 Tax=Nocardioides sp. TaxID=35761 RepID=UPI0039E6DB5C
MSARMSVIVPAHNEASVIARLLGRLVQSDTDRLLEIVVVVNGATDGTAATARATSPRIRVIEIPTASKTAALNAGDAATDLFPRAYVDADIEVDAPALLALADRLSEPGIVLSAAPRMVVDTTGASLGARAYQAVWKHTSYAVAGPIGGGVYALSKAARATFDVFPPVIADDLWIERVAGAGRWVDESHVFVSHAPRNLTAVVNRLTRATVGNLQLERHYGLAASTGSAADLVGRILRRPWLWPAFAVYAGVRMTAERRARRRLAAGALEWSRDDSSRA